MALDEEFDAEELDYDDTEDKTPEQEAEKNHRVLTLDDIRNAQDITEEQVHIPEWDGDVVIRSITFNELRKIRKAATRNGERDEDLLMQGVVMAGLVKPEILSADYRMLQERSASGMIRVFSAIMDKSNLGDDEQSAKQEGRFPRR